MRSRDKESIVVEASGQGEGPKGHEVPEETWLFPKRPNELIWQIRLLYSRPNFLGGYKRLGLDETEYRALDNFLDWLVKNEIEPRLIEVVHNHSSVEKRDNAYKSVMSEIREHVDRNQDVTKICRRALRALLAERRKEEMASRRKLREDVESIRLSPEQEKALENMDSLVYKLGSEMSPETAESIRKAFPSGNFLFHGTGLNKGAKILESGELLTSQALEMDGSIGGFEGISFCLNTITFLQGMPNHAVNFLIAPESVLGDKNQLSIPEGSCAMHEVQLLPRDWYPNPETEIPNQDPYADWHDLIRYPNEELPHMPVPDSFVICAEEDLPILKRVIAASGHLPKGIFTYPKNLLRTTDNEALGQGDAFYADQLIKSALGVAGVPEPSLDWHELANEASGRKGNLLEFSSKDLLRTRRLVRSSDGGIEITPFA